MPGRLDHDVAAGAAPSSPPPPVRQDRAALEVLRRRAVVDEDRLRRRAPRARGGWPPLDARGPRRRPRRRGRSDQEIVGRIGHRGPSAAPTGREQDSRRRAGRRRRRPRRPAPAGSRCPPDPAAIGRQHARRRGTRRRRPRTRTAWRRRRRSRGARGTGPARPGSSSGSRPPKIARRSAGGHERGQDQVDEAALVALAAPVVEPCGRVDVEGPVAAAERVVVLGELGEALRPPTARCTGRSDGEVVDRPAERLGQHRRKPVLERRCSWSTGG